MSQKKHRQQQKSVNWNALLSRLPAPAQKRFSRALRRSLKRRLEQIEQLDTSTSPDAVRSQAVSQWRKRYMKGESKAACKRMNYARLHDDPTYLQIERTLAARYWASRPGKSLPQSNDVDAMPFARACETYRATQPNAGSTPLDTLVREMARHEYDECAPQLRMRARIAGRICEAVRTQRLDAQDGPYALSFSLEGLTSEDEIRERVRKSGLIELILRVEFGKKPPYLVARDLIVERVAARQVVAAHQALMQALFGTYDGLVSSLERKAKPDAHVIEAYLSSEKMLNRVVRELLKNPYYDAQFRRGVELRLRVRENVPQTPMEAYPLARSMTRRIILHVGPTNSGKTHDALLALAAAPSGAYLGPLRLLAYEKFEELNREGCVCSLLTGEESVELPGAHHVSSTIEMANFARPIEVAIIDEAQMIADKSRGHHWTEALLGIPARQVHVCCAPHAEEVICELAALCEDELEIVRHERLVPLRPNRGAFHLPESVEPGDALIVFSRKSVHAVATQIAAAGMRPSVIYGALPHDVRHEEARRFDAGETDVVVATDAIGMGMNLPIRRVVFVEQEKFDGSVKRMLRPEEVQQIAGRAGRFGRYDEGLYQSTRLRKEMMRRYRQEVRAIESIPVGIPADIALVRDATLTDCIRQWMALDQPKPFRRIGVERDLALIAEVEKRLDEGRRTHTDDKLLVLSLATMAFDERDKDLYRMWLCMVDAELAGREYEFEVPPAPDAGAALLELEWRYRCCDLLYSYARTFNRPRQIEALTTRRNQISHVIMRTLANDGA